MLFVSDKTFIEGKLAKAVLMSHKSGSTQRVCRSTLAAEASHLADSVEASEWLAVLLAELNTPTLNLQDWQAAVHSRTRVFLTDAKSVFDYVTLEGTSHSRDKRMAIEGALLREAMAQPRTSLKWVDGSQNLADIVTKDHCDLDYFKQHLASNDITWKQSQAAADMKAKKASQRSKRKEAQKEEKEEKHHERRAASAARLREHGADD